MPLRLRRAAEDAPASAETAPVRPLELLAYGLGGEERMPLVPAVQAREWMAATPLRFANRCLPLLIANQAGWVVLNGDHVRVVWDGGDSLGALQVEPLGRTSAYAPKSHFGCGILTWNLPYLFRTPPGWNLLVRGPANRPKDGACALEGIVETDWSVATFTMNWKLTRPHHPVEFAENEPICMILPQRRGELEEFWPEQRDVRSDHEMAGGYSEWVESRARFLGELGRAGSQAMIAGWQKDYFRGTSPDGRTAREHQTKLRLREFRRA